MPNHWETSARPLFVKTVFVNGNRHAILFEKDPLLPFGNSKKISRSNSSSSFTSDVSSSSESQTSNLESKISKLTKTGQRQRKDLSSDLQNCLVKLKLASGKLENKNLTDEEQRFCYSKELKKSQSVEKGDLKQKKQKWNRDKTCKRVHGQYFYEDSKERKLTEKKNSRHSSCYVYNLENNKEKKNYCFVKISSQPSQFILNCSCEHKWNETHNCDYSNKNNLVISATIHNLVMTPNGGENLFENTFDHVFENSELHWNNHLTKSYYNSFSDRIFQWLDLARNKKIQKETFAHDDDSLNNIERIFSGKTYMNESKKTEYLCKSDNKILMSKKMGKNTQNKTHEQTEREVTGKANVETIKSPETMIYKDNLQGNAANLPTSFRDFNILTGGNSVDNLQNNQNSEIISAQTDSKTRELGFPASNLIKSPIKIQDLLLNHDSKENYLFKDRKVKETRKASTRRNKYKAAENSEDDSIITTHRSWEKKIRKKNIFMDKCDSTTKQSYCCCNKNLDEYVDKIKNDILTEEVAAKNQESINNLNIMGTSPVSIQNLLSPQQQSKLTYLQEEKIVWASEKNTGRPQLHIFLPTMRLRDQTDDSISECENLLNI